VVLTAFHCAHSKDEASSFIYLTTPPVSTSLHTLVTTEGKERGGVAGLLGEDVKTLVHQLLTALDKLHVDAGVCLRDLNPRNVCV
jgi:hypothetical protein